MIKIKQQISDLRKNTPKHIQWLLLAAAFVVVLILLTLLLTHKEEQALENTEDTAIDVSVSPNTIDWPSVTAGDTVSANITVSASAPVKIMNVYTADDIAGLDISKQTCTAMSQIDANTTCSINPEFHPVAAMTAQTVKLYIDWRDVNASDEMKNTVTAVMVLGATEPEPLVVPAPEPQPEPAPVATPDPEPAPAAIPEPEPVAVLEPEPAPVATEIRQDIEAIAPSSDVAFLDTPVAASAPVQTNNTTAPIPSEACSDFAMPAYNLSGVQSGWIRPSGGAYYYHPFSDTECKNPTGTYNPDNGIITDINDQGKKIGTDAEHIGYTTIQNGALPQLSNPATDRTVNRARQLTTEELENAAAAAAATASAQDLTKAFHVIDTSVQPDIKVGTSGTAVFSSDPFDRKFVLRQYKPIPATIVSEVRADPSLYGCTTDTEGKSSCTGQTLPVRATVDRNVYSDDGRTVVIPTGTLMLGYVTGEIPGPYKTVGRMQINWYQFILPSGVEFNFSINDAPFSGDSQGRAGVPGHGSTDYVEQLVMPMLTAIVPAAVNMIAPIADTFINQIDLDNNTVVQSGTVRSSELAKQELITAWNQVAQKLLVDAMDNTIPPFSIAAGTRITVYSPKDLVITCGTGNSKECSVETVTAASGKASEDKDRNVRQDDWRSSKPSVNYSDESWVGQVRSFDLEQYCITDEDGIWDIKNDNATANEIANSGYDYRTVLAYCQSLNYQAINNARQDALYQNQQEQFKSSYGTGSTFSNTISETGTLTGISGSQAYNEDILGLTYDGGTIQNPFVETATEEEAATTAVITCEGGVAPDEYGCCPGEIYTDMGEQGFNCCPEAGGDCFPPITF